MTVEHSRIETPVTTEVVTSPAPVATADRTSATAYDPYAARRQAGYRRVQAVYLLFGIVEVLVALRLVLRALGANSQAWFAEFIYGVTAPLVAPFVGLFGSPQAGASVLELHSIIALVAYALLGWLLAKLAWLMFGESRSAVATTASTVETRASRLS